MPDVIINHETPVLISTAASTQLAGATRLDMAGRFAFIPAPDIDFIDLIDIGDPELMERVNGIVTAPGPVDITINGKFGYISTLNKLQIADINDISDMFIIGETENIGTGLRDIFLIGKYALVLVQGPTPKLSVIDVENRNRPFEVTSLALNNVPIRAHHDMNYIYIMGDDGGVHIIDIQDPSKPVLQTYLDPAIDYPELSGIGKDIYASGRWAYALVDTKMVLLDLSDTTAPAAEPPFTVVASNTIEIHGGDAYFSSGEIVDVSDPFNIVSLVNGGFNADMITMSGKNAFGLVNSKLKSYSYSGIESPTGNIYSLKVSKLTVFDDIDACNNVRVHNKIIVGIGGIHSDGLIHSDRVSCNQIEISGNVVGTAKDPALLDKLSDIGFSDSSRIQIIDTYALVTSPTNNSLTIVNITDPSDLKILATIKDDVDLVGASAVRAQGNFAYVTKTDKVEKVNISNKSNPLLLGDSAVIGTTLKDIAVNGNLAYVASQSLKELQPLNISRVPVPTPIGFPLSLPRTINKIYNHLGFLYCASTEGGFFIIDITSGLNPSLTKDVIDPINLISCNDIYVSGIHAYIATSKGLEIWDISDKSNPVREGGFVDNVNHSGLAVTGNCVYLTGQLKVISVLDKTAPILIATENFTEDAIKIVGKILYGVRNGEFSAYDISGINMDGADIGTLRVIELEVLNDLIVGNNATFTHGIHVGDKGIDSDGPITALSAQIGNISIDQNIIKGTGTLVDLILNPDIGRVVIGGNIANEQLHVISGGVSTFENPFGPRGILITDDINPRLIFEASSEGSDKKIMLLNYFNENLHVSSLTDSGSAFEKQNILVLRRSGLVSIGKIPTEITAKLDIFSNTQGILLTRLTDVQKNAIASPPTSLLLNDTVKNTLERYSGDEWRSFATQGETDREAWSMANFPDPVSNVVTLNSGITFLKKSISMADKFVFADNQKILLRGIDSLNVELTYTGIDTLFTSLVNGDWDVDELTIILSGNNAKLFDIKQGNIDIDNTIITFAGTGGTIGTLENTVELFIRDLVVNGFENGITIKDSAGMVLENAVFRSNRQGSGATISIEGFLDAFVINDTVAMILGLNESAYFISPSITNNVTIRNAFVPISQFFKKAPDGSFIAVTDKSITTTITSVVTGLNDNAEFKGTITGLVDDDIIVHTGFGVSAHNGTFEAFGVGLGYQIRDPITKIAVPFTVNDSGSGLTSLTRFASNNHKVIAEKHVIVTSPNYNGVGSKVKGTPLTNSFELRIPFNGDDSGKWEVDLFKFDKASDLSVFNVITSAEAIPSGVRFVSTVALSGLLNNDVVTHTNFNVAQQLNGIFRITNVQTFSYDVVRQPAQFTVTDAGDSDSNLTRFDIIDHALVTDIGIQLKSLLYNEGGRIRAITTDTIDVSVTFKGDDKGIGNINSLNQKDPRVNVISSVGSPDSQIAGGWQVKGNTTEIIIPAIGTYVDLDFTSSPVTKLSFNERVLLTNPINGEIKFIGKTPRTIIVPLEAFISTGSSSTRRFKIKVLINRNDGNGFVNTPDNIEPEFDISSSGTKTRDEIGVLVREGDLLKWQIAQVTGASTQNPTVERGSLEIPTT